MLTSITILTLDERGAGVVGTLKDGARDGIAPVRTVSDKVMAPVGDFIGGIAHYGDLEAENDRLRRENERLRGVVARSQDALSENQTLRDQLDLEFVGDIPTVAARVISTSPSNHEVSVVINRGRDAGVADGMPVVTAGGLVGRVIRASRSTSVVLLITDRSSGVGVRGVSGDAGVAGGEGAVRALRVDGVDVESAVEKREMMVTSGLQQSVYPPNIPVGRVLRTRVRPGALQKDVALEPAAEFDKLTFVSVLQWSPLP